MARIQKCASILIAAALVVMLQFGFWTDKAWAQAGTLGNVIGKAGTAGFLGRAYDPYYFYQDPNKEYKLDDLTLRPEVPT